MMRRAQAPCRRGLGAPAAQPASSLSTPLPAPWQPRAPGELTTRFGRTGPAPGLHTAGGRMTVCPGPTSPVGLGGTPKGSAGPRVLRTPWGLSEQQFSVTVISELLGQQGEAELGRGPVRLGPGSGASFSAHCRASHGDPSSPCPGCLVCEQGARTPARGKRPQTGMAARSHGEGDRSGSCHSSTAHGARPRDVCEVLGTVPGAP